MVYFHSLLDLVYTYMYVYGIVYYLSNHLNHLFITIQKIIIMAITFKSITYVYV